MAFHSLSAVTPFKRPAINSSHFHTMSDRKTLLNVRTASHNRTYCFIDYSCTPCSASKPLFIGRNTGCMRRSLLLAPGKSPSIAAAFEPKTKRQYFKSSWHQFCSRILFASISRSVSACPFSNLAFELKTNHQYFKSSRRQFCSPILFASTSRSVSARLFTNSKRRKKLHFWNQPVFLAFAVPSLHYYLTWIILLRRIVISTPASSAQMILNL